MRRGITVEKAAFITRLGRIPLVRTILRNVARWYREGSVVTIRNGLLAGTRWKRSHRYVNGYWIGIYELPIQECLARELKPGNVFYDIGANAGFFTLLGAKLVGPQGHVYAFEPLPENIRSIRDQISLNGIVNCMLAEAAVTDKAGRTEFSQGSGLTQAHIRRPDEECGQVTVVKTVSLDEFVKGEPPPDFIKMDIEGAEYLALRGADRLIKGSNPPRFLIELHGNISQEVYRTLTEEGYIFFDLERSLVEPSKLPHHVLACPG